jgi:3-dehydroquinate synthetase
MLIESMAASMMEVCSVGLLDNIRSCIHNNFDPVSYSASAIPELNMVARKDKKSTSGNIVCSVIAEAGKPYAPLSLPETIMNKAWLQYLHETA